ncbi:N-acetylglucosamine kinase [Cohnella soli]|uniref:N-acetylglucosamine kinase n=1 Tax=Cohnella soli TaxID=425005 RepID=A0ABW0I0Y5_9BACL
MKYIVSLDGGGTKINCLIADERGKLIGRSIAGSTNSWFDTAEDIHATIRKAVLEALENGGVAVTDVALIYTAMPVIQTEVRRALVSVFGEQTTIEVSDEFTLSLFGAIQERYGGLVLSGTGSFAALRSHDSYTHIGGWGALMGDEGSGTHVGQQALKACALMVDGRGPSTLLLSDILRFWNQDKLLDVALKLYSAKPNLQRKLVSSLCPIVGQCANLGDEIAIRIMEEAGKQLADQMLFALERTNAHHLPLTVSGGVWKASPLMFQTFCRHVKERFPTIAIAPPKYEPVLGGILLGLEALGVDANQMKHPEYDDYSFPHLHQTPPHTEGS